LLRPIVELTLLIAVSWTRSGAGIDLKQDAPVVDVNVLAFQYRCSISGYGSASLDVVEIEPSQVMG
jgi:hypothetical protein